MKLWVGDGSLRSTVYEDFDVKAVPMERYAITTCASKIFDTGRIASRTTTYVYILSLNKSA